MSKFQFVVPMLYPRKQESPVRCTRLSKLLIISVPEAGIEPALTCVNWILNPARLPIPPLRLVENVTRTYSPHY